MRKLSVLILFTIMASLSGIVFADTLINNSQLPKAAQTFLTKYFPGDAIKKAKMDQGRRGAEYEVDLSSGAEVEFRDNGDWKKVKAAKGKSVPTAIIPSAISKYVSKNFAGQSIVEISRKRGGYEVELSNGSELKLTEDAKPMPARQYGNRPR
ncbi:MAG: PepSY-like domain-containing protein [Muribaculaceae bacterium]|nr:PepSY-like domain-containing protein [Muribaculaceae bacterium]